MNSKTVRCLYGRCGVMGNPKARKPETKNQNPESETGIRNRNRKPESRIRNPESTNQRKQVLQVSENY